MFSDERKAQILNRLETMQRVTVPELARHLKVSESTIRRDLQDLEEQGQLKRTHGGAVTKEVSSFEPTVQEKVVHFPIEKSAIARKAVTFIEPGDTILLDAGTTTLEIARQLPDIDITVLTNSMLIGQIVSQLNYAHLMLLGGEHRKTTGALTGPLTETLLSQINTDKLFLGANAVEKDRGVMTPNAMEAATKRAMIRSAREVILVADHSKLGKISLVKVCDLTDIDVFLTDKPAPPPYDELFEQINVNWISCTEHE
ncbi:MAG TPA: DeoR/GlpR family DNA-binding transcription regulator [Bacillales bacterium]|nr:DeoR/GlpR family DNA-binding transcription regulator [Bacillales bacterium]